MAERWTENPCVSGSIPLFGNFVTTVYNIFLFLFVFSAYMAAFSLSPIESVLFLILSFCIAGVSLFLMNVEFLGLMYIVVYVGAVAILFLFIIMMLNVKVQETMFERFLAGQYKVFIVIMILFLPISYILWLNIVSLVIETSFMTLDSNTNSVIEQIDNLQNLTIFGQILYNYFTVHFLMAGIILLIALIGCILIALDFNRVKKQK